MLLYCIYLVLDTPSLQVLLVVHVHHSGSFCLVYMYMYVQCLHVSQKLVFVYLESSHSLYIFVNFLLPPHAGS